MAAALLTPVLASGLARDPALRLQLHTGRNAALLAQLRAGELDLVLGRLGDPEAMAGLAFERRASTACRRPQASAPACCCCRCPARRSARWPMPSSRATAWCRAPAWSRPWTARSRWRSCRTPTRSGSRRCPRWCASWRPAGCNAGRPRSRRRSAAQARPSARGRAADGHHHRS
ncbi:LysR substrate-binding domain-containing protein [Piscinibacter sakaiensis]|uniref:LysR substrate-binding domain-containing protein n=1 Tax=Piscinibacter sakaiensis TaxID=1547922 RepID=UPI003729C769